MREKTRKIISRLGAVLMLGVSLFNFGSVVKRQGTDNILRRSKNYRKKEAEQLDTGQQEIAQIAEEEAEGVIAQVQAENQIASQEYRDDARSAFRGALRYSAVGIWAISASIFFTSMVFNYPFGWGEGLLSLLPGNPHLAWAKIRIEKKSYQVGDRLTAIIKADTAGSQVLSSRLVIDFDEEVLSFEDFSLSESPMKLLESWQLKKPGQIEFIIKTEKHPVLMKNDSLLEFSFLVKKEAEFSKISLNIDDSRILTVEDDEYLNILGRVGFGSFKSLPRSDYQVVCSEIDASKKSATPRLWEPILIGTLLPNKKSNWNSISSELAFVCGHYRDAKTGQIQFLVSGPREVDEKINKIYLKKGNTVKHSGELVDRWEDQGRWFLAFSFSLNLNNQNQVEKPEDFSLEFLSQKKAYDWPVDGSANFLFE